MIAPHLIRLPGAILDCQGAETVKEERKVKWEGEAAGQRLIFKGLPSYGSPQELETGIIISHSASMHYGRLKWLPATQWSFRAVPTARAHQGSREPPGGHFAEFPALQKTHPWSLLFGNQLESTLRTSQSQHNVPHTGKRAALSCTSCLPWTSFRGSP